MTPVIPARAMKNGIRIFLSFALVQALMVSNPVAAAETACKGFVGHFATKPHAKVQLKIEKNADGYSALVEGDSEGSWERQSLEVGLTPDMKEDMVTDAGKPIPMTCVMRTEGLTLIQYPPGSPFNPSESHDRDISKYPVPTPYIMVVQAGGAAGDMGLYPAASKAEEAASAKDEEVD